MADLLGLSQTNPTPTELDLLGLTPPRTPFGPDALADLYRAVNERARSEGRRPLGGPAPIWDLNNPVGTESVGGPEMRSASPDFVPARMVAGGAWGPERPISQAAYNEVEEGSKWLFDEASMMAPGGSAPSGGGRPVMAAQRRVRAPGAPPGPRVRRGAPSFEPAPADVEPPPGVGHNMPPEPTPAPAPAPTATPGATVADIGGGQRGMMAVPSLRSMTPAEAAVASRSEPHLIPKPDGGYVGAPASVRTPLDLTNMRAELDRAIAAGAEGRDWYGTSRAWNTEITGTGFDPVTGQSTYGDPTQARRAAEGIAAFSPQADPNTNLQFTLQARNAYERGFPEPKVRNTQSATTYNTGMAAKDLARSEGRPEPDIKLGPKTEPFGWHLSPDRPYGTTGVNDIWHARSFGYKNPDGSEFSGSPTTAQHMFMDYETVLAIDRANARKTGGFTDWNAATVQAAPWVANKEASLAARYPKWSPEKVKETALKTYQDFAPGSTAYMTHEQMPGESTGLLGLVPEDSRAFTNRATWKDPTTGRDTLLGDLYWQPRMLDTGGTFRNSAGELEMNPSHTSRPLVDFTAQDPEGPVRPREIHPGTKAALSGVSASRGLLDVQEGMPYHYIDTRDAVPASQATSMRLTGARPTPEQLERLQGVAEKHGYYLSDTGDGVSLIHSGEGNAPADGIDLKKRLKGGMQAEIDAALPGAKTTLGRGTSEYYDLAGELAESVKGQGLASTKVIGTLNEMKAQAPKMYDKLMDSPAAATKAQANLDRLTPEMRAARPDYVKLLDIVAKGKLRGFMEHVNKFGAVGLPAALATYYASDRD